MGNCCCDAGPEYRTFQWCDCSNKDDLKKKNANIFDYKGYCYECVQDTSIHTCNAYWCSNYLDQDLDQETTTTTNEDQCETPSGSESINDILREIMGEPVSNDQFTEELNDFYERYVCNVRMQ
jgi:hypothetical protein